MIPRPPHRAFGALVLGLCTASAVCRPLGPSIETDPIASHTPGPVETRLTRVAAQPDQISSAPATARGTPLGAPAPAGATPLVPSDGAVDPHNRGGSLLQTVIALSGVLSLIIGLAWLFKKAARTSGGLNGSLGAGGRAPAGLVEVLGRYPLASRQTLVVLRFDHRVLLCAMSAGSRSASPGMSVLSELTDPEDVASVLVKSRDESGESIARSFERSLRDAEQFADDATEHVPLHARVRPEADRASVFRAFDTIRGRASR